MRQIHFTLPEHSANARALGYACGLATGIASPHYPPDELPPFVPVQAKGSFSTNDINQFGLLFAEGHELGLLFGRQAAKELSQALSQVPQALWWSVCMAFGAEQMQMLEESSDEQVRQAVEVLRTIYQRHLL